MHYFNDDSLHPIPQTGLQTTLLTPFLQQGDTTTGLQVNVIIPTRLQTKQTSVTAPRDDTYSTQRVMKIGQCMSRNPTRVWKLVRVFERLSLSKNIPAVVDIAIQPALHTDDRGMRI